MGHALANAIDSDTHSTLGYDLREAAHRISEYVVSANILVVKFELDRRVLRSHGRHDGFTRENRTQIVIDLFRLEDSGPGEREARFGGNVTYRVGFRQEIGVS